MYVKFKKIIKVMKEFSFEKNGNETYSIDGQFGTMVYVFDTNGIFVNKVYIPYDKQIRISRFTTKWKTLNFFEKFTYINLILMVILGIIFLLTL